MIRDLESVRLHLAQHVPVAAVAVAVLFLRIVRAGDRHEERSADLVFCVHRTRHGVVREESVVVGDRDHRLFALVDGNDGRAGLRGTCGRGERERGEAGEEEDCADIRFYGGMIS